MYYPLLGGEVEGDPGLDGLDLLGLALIHNLAGKTLGGELFVQARNLLVEWLHDTGLSRLEIAGLGGQAHLELLFLGDLCTEQLVVKHLELELDGIAASLGARQLVSAAMAGAARGRMSGTCFSCSSSSWRDWSLSERWETRTLLGDPARSATATVSAIARLFCNCFLIDY